MSEKKIYQPSQFYAAILQGYKRFMLNSELLCRTLPLPPL
jgi:hypothetical protein